MCRLFANNLLKHEIDNALNELDICKRKFEEKSADAAAVIELLGSKVNSSFPAFNPKSISCELSESLFNTCNRFKKASTGIDMLTFEKV